MNKKIRFLILQFVTIFSFNAIAQIPSGNPDCMPGDGLTISLNDGVSMYLGGYGASSPILRIPVVTKIDTLGAVIWSKEYNIGHTGSVINMLLKDNNLYVVSIYDSTSSDVFEISKIDNTSGNIIWKNNILAYSKINNGGQQYNTLKSMIILNDTISLLINRDGNNQISSHIISVNSITGGTINTYIDTNHYELEDITIDTIGNYYAIGKDSVYCLSVQNPGSIIWRTYIDNSDWNAQPSKVLLKDGNIFVMTSNGSLIPYITKLNSLTGSILWSASGPNHDSKITNYIFDNNYLYTTWDDCQGGGGSHFIQSEKVDLVSGNVLWKSYVSLPGSGRGTAFDILLNDSFLIVTGYANQDVYTSNKKIFWYNLSIDTSDGSKNFFNRTFLDSSRSEEYSSGKGLEIIHDELFYLGNLQTLEQQTFPSSYVNYPMTNIGLIKLDSFGNESYRKMINMGTSPINTPLISDSVICVGEEILLTSNNLLNWSYEWQWITSGSAFDASFTPDTSLFLNSSNTITSIINNGLCSKTTTWDVVVNQIPIISVANFNPDTVCINTGLLTLPIGSPIGGYYTGSGIIGSDFDPIISGVGEHYIYYTFLDTNACSNTDTSRLFVNPVYSITVNQSVYEGDSILIYSNYEYLAGIYYDSLQTTVGCDSILSTVLTVLSCNATTNYTYLDNSNGNFSFTNTSSGSFNQIHWAFGDGSTSTIATPNHTFSANGIYLVVLTVHDSTSDSPCIDYFLDTIVVTGVVAPLQCAAGFVIYPDTTINNVIVVNSSTGTNLTYLWSFGDGDTSTLQTPTHTYAASGPYYLCLTIDDGAGCVDTYCDSIGENGVVFNKQTGFTINVIAPPLVTQVNEQVALTSGMNIYPNPTGNLLNVVLKEKEHYQLTIVTIDGKWLESKTIASNTTVDVSKYASGMYFITATNNEGKVYQSKFVKE